MTKRAELIQNVQVTLWEYNRLGGYRRALRFWFAAIALVQFANKGVTHV